MKNEYPQRGNENIIKKIMLSLEGAALQSARKSTSTMLLMLGSTEANRSKADEQAQVEIPSDLSEALDEHRYEIGEGEVPF